MQKIKILHYIASTVWGGAEKSFAELCNNLSEQMEVIVVLQKRNEIEKRLKKNIKVFKIPNGSRYSPSIYLKLMQIIKTNNPDIVHTHSAKASEIAYILNKIVDFIHIATKRNTRKGSIFNKIKYVTAISKAAKNSILNQNAILIYNGIVKQDIEENIEKNRVFTVLAVGELTKIKGFDILIKEVAKLDFPFELQIAGEGSERASLEKLIYDLNLSKKVKLLGYTEDVPRLISKADTTIISSHSEGFSRVVVETLFYGKMIVSTKVGLSLEILPDNLLVEHTDIADKLTEIHNNQPHYTQLFHNIKEKYSDKFELKNNIHNYIEFYKRVLNESKKR